MEGKDGARQSRALPVQAPKKTPSSFHFVSFSHVDEMRDAAAISRIRHHAMKDIGRSRRKSKPQRMLKVHLDVPPDFESSVPRSVGGGAVHTFFKLPVELDSIGRLLFANIFEPLDAGGQTAHREDWLSVALANAPTFNQVLANSELHLEAVRHPHRFPRETPTSIWYHQLAIRAVREELANDTSTVSDSVIGTVTGMVAYAEISGVFEYWLPQRTGLVNIIKSRQTGIQSIESNVHLRASVSWVELQGSYRRDLPPAFPLLQSWVDIESETILSEAASLKDIDPPRCLRTLASSAPAFAKLLKRLTTLCQHISYHLSAHHPSPLNPARILVCTNVIVHELLNTPVKVYEARLGSATANLDVIRLACLLFAASVYRTCGASPLITRTLVAKQHLCLTAQTSWPDDLEDLRLWSLVVSALEATHDCKTVFLREICVVAVEMELESVEEILARARALMWIPEIFDGKVSVLLGEIRKTMVESMTSS